MFFDTVLYGNVSNCKCCAKNTWKSKKPLAVGQEAKDMLGKTPGRVKMVSAYSDPDVNQVHVTWDKTTNYSQMDYPSQNEYSRG